MKHIKTVPMNSHLNPRSLAGYGRWLGILGLFIGSVAAYALILQTFVLSHYPGGIDFYTVWKAAQALFLFHRDPYSQQVTQEIQQGIYGHALTTPQGEYLFVYPLPFLLLVFPIAWLPFTIALAWWLACLQIGAIVVLMLFLNHYHLGRRPLTRALYILWALLLYPSMVAFWVGQPAVLVFLLFGLAWYAFSHHRDWLVGICLGLTLIKFYVIAVPLCFFLVYALSRRRFKVLLGWAGVSVGLLAVSFLVWPTWVPGFLTNAGLWTNQTEVLSHDVSALQLFTDVAGTPLSTIFLAGAAIILGLVALKICAQALKDEQNQFEYALVITLLFQASILPHQHAPNQMLLIIPGLYVLKQFKDRQMYFLFWLFAMGTFITPWLIRFLIPNAYAGDEWIIVPIPLLLTAALLLKHKLQIRDEIGSAAYTKKRSLKRLRASRPVAVEEWQIEDEHDA